MTWKVRMQVCSSLNVDIITFDLSKRLPFRLKPALLQEAVNRGIHLEICYAAAIRDEGARRTCFTNALGNGLSMLLVTGHSTHCLALVNAP